jgi:hypothetical protein
MQTLTLRIFPGQGHLSLSRHSEYPGSRPWREYPRQMGTGPEFFKIGRRLYTTVGELRRWIREQRLASQPVIGRPKAG